MITDVNVERLVAAVKELDQIRTENERLRHDLLNPPADIQELVIKKLGLVSGEALAKAEAEIGRLKGEVELCVKVSDFNIKERVKLREQHAADLAHHKQLLVERDRVLGVARECLVNAQHALRCSDGEEQPNSISEIDATLDQINKVLEVPK